MRGGVTVLTPRLARSGGTFPEACVLDLWKPGSPGSTGSFRDRCVESFAPASKHTVSRYPLSRRPGSEGSSCAERCATPPGTDAHSGVWGMAWVPCMVGGLRAIRNQQVQLQL
eukprot:2521695-Prymnesium_polylepis.1